MNPNIRRGREDFIGLIYYQVGLQNTYYLVAKLMFGLCFAYCTNFVPDEYWQSTEVAYQMAFGKGHLTWEWMIGIRSTLVPVLIAIIYKLGSFVGLSNLPLFLSFVPQFLQGMLSLKASMLFFQFCVLRMGIKVGRLAFVFFMMNWFTLYCSARTISNQTEMSLNIMCLWYLQTKKYPNFVFTLVVNFLIRPTAALFWIPFISEVIFVLTIRHILVLSLLGLIPFTAGTAIDMLVYRDWTITWWEFFKFNILNSGNEEFGVHPKFWYFYSALPSILGPLFGFLPFGLFCGGDTRRLSVYILSFLAIMSSIGHKEIRFLLPVLPLVFLVVASVVHKLSMYIKRNVIFLWQHTVLKNTLMAMVVVLNTAAVVYLGVFHLRGFRNISVQLNWLTTKMEKTPEVWIMTPCYSMPVYTFTADARANYMYYICPPGQYNDFYDFSTNSSLLHQTGIFADQDIERDIKMKARSRGPPDYIITYGEYYLQIRHVMYEMGYYYLSIMECRHSYFGDFGRFVHLLAQVDEKRYLDALMDKKDEKFFPDMSKNTTEWL